MRLRALPLLLSLLVSACTSERVSSDGEVAAVDTVAPDADTSELGDPDLEPDLEPDASTDTDTDSDTGPDTRADVDTQTNTAPTVRVALVSPDSPPTRLSTLTCEVSATDPDGDTLTTTWSWFVDDDLIAAATPTLSGAFAKGQRVRCRVAVSDGSAETQLDSEPLTIASAPPSLSAVRLEPVGCKTLRCVGEGANDPDGDPVTFHYRWSRDGETLAATGPELAADGALICHITPDDGETLGAESSSEPATAIDRAPVADARIAAHARAGDLVQCEVTASDDCDAVTSSVTWRLGDVEVGSGESFDTTGLPTGAALSCEVRVVAGPDEVSVVSNTIRVAASRLVIEATLADGYAGYAVAIIDDLDGDELAELAIGAPNTSRPEASQAGALYLVLGRDDTDHLSLADVISGEAGHYLGGDRGSFDVALMACGPAFYQGGCPKLRPVGELTADIEGPAGAGLGFALGYAGDMNGDGLGDLVVSTPYELYGDLWRGRTYVTSGTSLWGDPLNDADLGVAGFVFDGECGRRRGLDLQMSSEFVAKAANGDLTGYRVVGVGDMDGDGLGDHATSAPNHGDRDEGTVYVVFGRDDRRGVTGSDLFSRGCAPVDTIAEGAEVGRSGFAAYGPNLPPANAFPIRWGKLLARAGDFNGDGLDDLLVPTPGFSAASNSTFVILGHTAARSMALVGHDPERRLEIYLGDFRFLNGTSTGRLGAGFPSGGGGDLNGDGFDDLAFAAIDFDRQTFMNTLYGRADVADGLLHTNEGFDGSGRGFAVGGSIDLSTESGVLQIVGDMNGDGYDDIALGSPVHGNPDAGVVVVVYGSPTPPVGLTLAQLRQGMGGFVIDAAAPGEQLGWSLDGGDMDGDGLDDLVIGAPRATVGGKSNAGRVIIEYGRDRSRSLAFAGGPDDDRFVGTSAAESMVGGRGDDHLHGGGGADVLYGGAGDDLLEVGDATFRRVRGGAGEDTLVLAAGVVALDLSGAHRNRLREIERIRLQGQTVSLSTREISRLSETSNRLHLEGTGTVVTRPGDRWVFRERLEQEGRAWLVFDDGHAEIHVEATLGTAIPPTVYEGLREVAENSPLGSVVTRLDAVDPDGHDGGPLTFALLPGPGSDEVFDVDAQSGELIVLLPEALDFESGASWDLTVAVTDQDGLTTLGSFTIALADRPEAPRFVAAPSWSFEEDRVGGLGTVAALDVDRGDTLSYSLSHDVDGLFAIEPESGLVSLRSDRAFDYESRTSHTATLRVTDATGLFDEVPLTVTVLDRETLETQARVTFELRGWSIWDDSSAASFDGFQIDGFDEDQVAETCVSQDAGDTTHSETWTPLIPASTGVGVGLPLRFSARYLGQICTSNELVFDEGTFNATVPVDVTLEVPDEITPGQTITIGSSATPSFEGAALWGRTTGIEIGWSVRMVDFGVRLEFCEGITNSCAVPIDRQGLDTTFNDRWGSPSKPWNAGQLTDPERFVLTVAEPIEADPLDLTVDWDQFMFNVATAMGLPSNKGRIEKLIPNARGPGADVTVRFDYVILQTEAGLKAENSWVFWLEVLGVDAVLVFENGAEHAFRLGTETEVLVPSDADVDGDGRVEVEVRMALDSTFNNVWDHREEAGYLYTGGFGRLRATDEEGYILGQRQVGPAMEHFCAPKGRGDPFTPLKCYVSTGTETTSFRPRGFSEPSLRGGLDLTTP